MYVGMLQCAKEQRRLPTLASDALAQERDFKRSGTELNDKNFSSSRSYLRESEWRRKGVPILATGAANIINIQRELTRR